VRVVKEYARPRLPQVWAQLQLPRHAPGGLLSFCNLAPVAVRRQIACIHDMQTRLTPASYGRLFRLAHHLILPLLGRRAAVITTVSETSRQAIVGLRVAPGSKVALAPNGSDHALRWAPERARLSVASRRPFVLAIGRGMPHKNAALLIRIAKRLDAIGLDLWLAGEIGEEELRRLGAAPGPALRVLGRVSDDDLAAALRAALCFAFPSRSEGFGLPAVEAMALGCPVVASTAPSLPEVCGEAALYADPDDEEAWVAAIDRLRRDPALRADLIERGRARAATYAWRATAETYLALMASVDRQDRTGRPRP
jgi:glycosyltransferase involved in cell wall biosynthesis